LIFNGNRISGFRGKSKTVRLKSFHFKWITITELFRETENYMSAFGASNRLFLWKSRKISFEGWGCYKCNKYENFVPVW